MSRPGTKRRASVRASRRTRSRPASVRAYRTARLTRATPASKGPKIVQATTCAQRCHRGRRRTSERLPDRDVERVAITRVGVGAADAIEAEADAGAHDPDGRRVLERQPGRVVEVSEVE